MALKVCKKYFYNSKTSYIMEQRKILEHHILWNGMSIFYHENKQIKHSMKRKQKRLQYQICQINQTNI